MRWVIGCSRLVGVMRSASLALLGRDLGSLLVVLVVEESYLDVEVALVVRVLVMLSVVGSANVADVRA